MIDFKFGEELKFDFQAMMDDILKRASRSSSIKFIPITITIDDIKAVGDCDHKWAVYFGFSESYRFCEKCDEKRECGQK